MPAPIDIRVRLVEVSVEYLTVVRGISGVARSSKRVAGSSIDKGVFDCDYQITCTDADCMENPCQVVQKRDLSLLRIKILSLEPNYIAFLQLWRLGEIRVRGFAKWIEEIVRGALGLRPQVKIRGHLLSCFRKFTHVHGVAWRLNQVPFGTT